MPKTFPLFSQTEVTIIHNDKGDSFSCPMLPIADLDKVNELTGQLATTTTNEGYESIRQGMIELAKTVIPAEYHENFARFNLGVMIELIGYLAYGEGSDSDGEKKS